MERVARKEMKVEYGEGHIEGGMGRVFADAQAEPHDCPILTRPYK
jgi:hypothetical protein